MGSVETLVLKGIKGIAEGEKFYLQYGQRITIGRSRVCEVSFQKCPRYERLSPAELKHKDILSISRKHLRISFYNPQSIELKDLSTNGTFVNGERIKKKVISDIRDKSYEIRLGTHETFILEKSELPAISQNVQS